MTISTSPYAGYNKSDWISITNNLIETHPLNMEEIVSFCLAAWNNLFSSSIGRHSLKFGVHIFPTPQVIGALLHELIPAEIVASYPGIWQREQEKDDKDIVYLPDNAFSIELKTSSNSNRIFGNRSYAQAPTQQKKSKDGYYLTVNFEQIKKNREHPDIAMIGFGWLDHTDWIGQTSATGQQARLAPETYELKLRKLYFKP
jgi:ScaI restriction endonuclease